MLKFSGGTLAVLPLAALVLSAPADAAILGPSAAACASGDGPAVLVKIAGLKNRAGTVRARLFAGGRPASWFDKRAHIGRIQVPTPANGAVEICMPVPRPGAYVVDVRHDINNNGDTDRSDGGGASGNPKIGLMDVLFGRKPPAKQVVFNVGAGITPIIVAVNYATGSAMASRR